MTKEDRQSLILSQLMKQGSLLVSDLALALDVSTVTIRKDLTELEKKGRLYRSHGRAIMMNPFANNRSISEKGKVYQEEKYCIGREAARLITKDDSIIIASGTTVQAFARSIKPSHRLTVVSASLPVSEALAANEGVDIIQLGGNLRHSSLSVIGLYAETFLKDCFFSKLFLGVDGIDLDFGFTTTNMGEAQLNQKMIDSAQKTIVLADSSKFGRRGFAKIGNMDDIDMIITDDHITDSQKEAIESLGIDLIIAKPDATEMETKSI
ncbi:DeoR/GlpR family DNA-binding transcription regulator [Prevotella cerevisiae]|uniref:DeoR/GlpR family DNA-binding transcription regulator n=1 Tax=Segatella cerevisiae TaxID=2053716 RepID=A0ABT1C010_9BACT|nr:DeoR/GlpR family DNA-binding transcription regulator [Segatella cerevisiae]MCO6026285.1 DeoR/GlpR family DNA-binding transcription regulator [Segatella cerevisiae]